MSGDKKFQSPMNRVLLLHLQKISASKVPFRMFQSPMNRVLLLHLARIERNVLREINVSIPYESGLTFTLISLATTID